MDRIHEVDFTVPLGTLSALPITQSVPLEDSYLVNVELLVPPGHCGLTGLRIQSSRQQIIPWGSSGWLTADNYTNTFPVNTEIGRRAISVQGYNTDVYDHTFYIRFHLRDLGAATEGLIPTGGSSIVGMSGGDGPPDLLPPSVLPPGMLPPALPAGMIPVTTPDGTSAVVTISRPRRPQQLLLLME